MISDPAAGGQSTETILPIVIFGLFRMRLVEDLKTFGCNLPNAYEQSLLDYATKELLRFPAAYPQLRLPPQSSM